jgi:hypothetical protein
MLETRSLSFEKSSIPEQNVQRTVKTKETILSNDNTKNNLNFLHIFNFVEGQGEQHGGMQDTRKAWGQPSSMGLL